MGGKAGEKEEIRLEGGIKKKADGRRCFQVTNHVWKKR